MSSVQVAIDAAGGQAALARMIGIKRVSVHQWKTRGVIPAERVLAVEQATGVPRHVLRPDLYPREIMPAKNKNNNQRRPKFA